MKRKIVFGVFALLAARGVAMTFESGPIKVVADDIAADHKNEALYATGNVDVVCSPYRLLTSGVEKEGDKITFGYPTIVTTCTNDLCNLHWRTIGKVEYKDGNYIKGENMTTELFGVPCLWLPYWYYPIGSTEGLRMMPGYSGRWGAYLLSKYVYHIAGERATPEDSDVFSLKGASRVDLRTKNGIAFGQSLRWNLGEFGKGNIKGYFARDNDWERYKRHWRDPRNHNYEFWGSAVKQHRWAVEFKHVWDVTERDIFRVNAMATSDSYVQRNFLRESFFSLKNQFLGVGNNEMALEHNENAWGAGVNVTGPLTKFYTATEALPEVYFDIMPMNILSTPLNYEGSLRMGYMRRQSARFGGGRITDFSYSPGHWADYGTFRLDTYHRLTLPMKIRDVLSVVPRLGYHGTFYGNSGDMAKKPAVMMGRGKAARTDSNAFRSVVESGVTFSARGTAWIDDEWQSVIEPYLDVLAQAAHVNGVSRHERPYVFDSIDASRDWSDQFAGRGRNLPYSYAGLTPGFRKLLRTVNANGEFRTVFDVDVYAAMQFGKTDWDLKGNKAHRLAKNGKSNYGEDSFNIMPGVRLNWNPTEETSLGMWAEYDSDNKTIALADVRWRHALARNFSYWVRFTNRNHRWWDFSSSPRNSRMRHEDFNWARFRYLDLGFEHELCDAVAWSPFISWDFREHELDEIGTWVEYRTDCLGFRLSFAYSNDCRRLDGSMDEHDYRVEFIMYLRALGMDAFDVMKDN